MLERISFDFSLVFEEKRGLSRKSLERLAITIIITVIYFILFTFTANTITRRSRTCDRNPQFPRFVRMHNRISGAIVRNAARTNLDLLEEKSEWWRHLAAYRYNFLIRIAKPVILT